jgi:hypothetical protein
MVSTPDPAGQPLTIESEFAALIASRREHSPVSPSSSTVVVTVITPAETGLMSKKSRRIRTTKRHEDNPVREKRRKKAIAISFLYVGRLKAAIK